MTDADLGKFQSLLRRICAIYRVRADESTFPALSHSYFHALRGFDLASLERGADAWIANQPRFPKPVEWKGAIPRRQKDIPALTDAHRREYRRAEAQRWEDEPCGCQSCVEAGVSDRPLRFLPESDEFDRDLEARDGLSGQTLVRGHWSHGWELRRYYDARAAYCNAFYEWLAKRTLAKKVRRLTFHERMREIFPDKPHGDARQAPETSVS